jgi:hypothetical protein
MMMMMMLLLCAAGKAMFCANLGAPALDWSNKLKGLGDPSC